MPHRALVNLISWQIASSSFSLQQRTLQFAALGFDVSFQETFCTFCSGGILVLIDEDSRLNPAELCRLIQRRGIQRLFLPYVALQVLAEELTNKVRIHDQQRIDFPLQNIITAGEQLRIDPRIAELFGCLGKCRFENQYGPTETHVASAFTLSANTTCWPILPPIGRPISNTLIYILDRHRQPVPVGVAGELYIGGAGVARGYLNHAELTAERFLRDPFAVEAGDWMYKTGDLGSWLPDGNIEYLGRNDDQVKIRGFRVEVGEIEVRLKGQLALREVMVVAREDKPGEKRLVAYYTVREGGDQGELGAEKLRAYLSAEVPEYMIPAAFVRLERMPLTPNGKLDRKGLPTPEGDAYGVRDYEEPRGETEKKLAEIWAEVLRVEKVGRHDNFFELGGHSLLVIKLVRRIEDSFGVDIAFRGVFADPRLSSLAEQVVIAELAQFNPEDLVRMARKMIDI